MSGGDDADTFVIHDNFGNDTISGGEGGIDDDVIDLSAMTGPVTVSFTGDEAGTITDGTDTITFSEIEQVITTDQADIVDATGKAGTGGISVDTRSGNDTITGGNGDDTIVAGDGDDNVDGGSGADRVEGGAGADTVSGGGGSDTLIGGAGDDSLNGGGNADSIEGGDGQDTIQGGAGGDTIDGGAGADSIEGGGGNDFIRHAVGGDTVDGGAGSDTIYGGFAPGDDDAVLRGGDGNDSIVTYGANDTVFGDAGNDTIVGDAGNESFDGGADDDDIWGGDGDDTITGGTGRDTVEGGAGNDSLSGGDGDDVFVYAQAEGADTITDFNFGNSGAIGDGDTTNNDFIDLSGFYDRVGELREDFDDDGVLNQSNSTANGGDVDYSDNAQMDASNNLTFQGASRDSFTADNTGVVCFAKGMRIATPRGPRAVESLEAGDVVCTHSGALLPLVWTGKTELALQSGHRDPRRTPVRIKPVSGGGNRALLVSPQHCMLMTLSDGSEAFARARHLAEETKLASYALSRPRVSYVHLCLARHDILICEGRPSESFYPGRWALRSLPEPDLGRLLRAVPTVRPGAGETGYGPRAAPILARHEIRKLTAAGTLAFAPLAMPDTPVQVAR
ncbi:Hint domain-containing protein [Sulfitobacter albidus]|uniref:Hint domain-containing protein n=1 Tax=Sulfitobacter albidus TaxID=2829501 RepID=UPI0020C8B974|nr:Hint domain-containing protein [Sulfitobacter albidus]